MLRFSGMNVYSVPYGIFETKIFVNKSKNANVNSLVVGVKYIYVNFRYCVIYASPIQGNS